MSVVMDLIAGDAREILLAIGVDDWSGLRDPARFTAYLPLGGRIDLASLDLLSSAVRTVTGDDPGPFSEACRALDDPKLNRLQAAVDRTIERVDAHWIDDVALVPDWAIDAIAARWLELIEHEETGVDPDHKPTIPAVTAELVDFCRRAQTAEDVLLAWTI